MLADQIRRKIKSAARKAKTPKVKKDRMYLGNHKLPAEWSKLCELPRTYDVFWSVYVRYSENERYVGVKLASNYSVAKKANYWFSFDKKEDRLAGLGKDPRLLREHCPELHALVLAYLRMLA